MSLRGEKGALRECRDLAVVAAEAATAKTVELCEQLTAVTESVGFWQRKADGLRLGFDTLGAENIQWTTRFQEEVDAAVVAEVRRRTGLER